jgi:hypothetical protein
MEIWKKFIEESSITQELVQKYLEIRLLLKELGHTEESAARIKSGPTRLFELKADIAMIADNLRRNLINFGFDVPPKELTLYFQSKMNKIDSLIPLNDGNNERRNQGDEDY